MSWIASQTHIRSHAMLFSMNEWTVHFAWMDRATYPKACHQHRTEDNDHIVFSITTLIHLYGCTSMCLYVQTYACTCAMPTKHRLRHANIYKNHVLAGLKLCVRSVCICSFQYVMSACRPPLSLILFCVFLFCCCCCSIPFSAWACMHWKLIPRTAVVCFCILLLYTRTTHIIMHLLWVPCVFIFHSLRVSLLFISRPDNIIPDNGHKRKSSRHQTQGEDIFFSLH